MESIILDAGQFARRSALDDTGVEGLMLGPADRREVSAVRFRVVRTTMRGVDWRDANLRRSRWEDSTITECLFDDAFFVGASIANCTFWKCQFARASLRTVVLSRVSFERCGFTSVTFDGAVGEYLQFDRCTLTDVDLMQVTFRGCDILGEITEP